MQSFLLKLGQLEETKALGRKLSQPVATVPSNLLTESNDAYFNEHIRANAFLQ